MTFRHPPARRKTWGQRFDDLAFFYAFPACIAIGVAVLCWQIWRMM
jgi:hypothetical protein